MNYQNLFKIALRAIGANKMRSFLTALGIIIGIAAVITMLAIGQGSKASIKANIAEMGSNMIMISPGADMRGGVRQDASSMETLKQADYESIKEDCNYISAISPTVNSAGQWIYGNNNTQSSIYGVNQDYLSIRQLKVADGEMFTDADIKAAAKVCILGQTVVDYLFPDGSDPIGKVVRFNSIPFRVVGVLQKKGYNSMGMDQDDLVLAPYTTVMKRIMAQTYLGGIVCSAITEEASEPAQNQITDILRRNHKLKDATDTTGADDDDFNIRSQEEISSMMNSTMSTITILLGSVAGISLLVGRHRHHEHHVCLGHRAHPRDRTPHECGRPRHRHPQPVPHRGHTPFGDRRHHRSHTGSDPLAMPQHLPPHRHADRAVEHHHELRRMHPHRRFLRLVSRQEGSPSRPHRGHTLRIMSPSPREPSLPRLKKAAPSLALLFWWL